MYISSYYTITTFLLIHVLVQKCITTKLNLVSLRHLYSEYFPLIPFFLSVPYLYFIPVQYYYTRPVTCSLWIMNVVANLTIYCSTFIGPVTDLPYISISRILQNAMLYNSSCKTLESNRREILVVSFTDLVDLAGDCCIVNNPANFFLFPGENFIATSGDSLSQSIKCFIEKRENFAREFMVPYRPTATKKVYKCILLYFFIRQYFIIQVSKNNSISRTSTFYNSGIHALTCVYNAFVL